MISVNNLRKYSRYQATFAHFLFSLLIFTTLGYLVYFCWYPQPLFSVDAGWQGLRILAFVDFVLGPCLTLVIFNPKKKELFKDVAIIALIQFSALSYGTYHVYQSRPAFVVYADNGFYTAAYSQLKHFPLSTKQLDEVQFFQPTFKIMDIPRKQFSLDYAIETDNFVNYEKLQTIRALSLQEKTPFYLLDGFLTSYETNKKIINQSSYNLDNLASNLTDKEQRILSTWKKENPFYHDFSYTSLIGRFGTVIVQIDKETGNIVNFINISFHDGYL